MAPAWVINLAVAEWVIRRPAVAGPAAPRRRSAGGFAMSRRTGAAAPTGYDIRLEGHLDEHWSTWFDGFDPHPRGRRHHHPARRR